MPNLYRPENSDKKQTVNENDKQEKYGKQANREENSKCINPVWRKKGKMEIENRPRKETLKMITKTFEPKEMLPFSQLRTLNQKELIYSLEENDKVGIVIKDQLKVAMIDMEKYQKIVDALQEYERLLDLIEERELYEQIHHRLQSNDVVEYKEGMSLLEMAGIHPRR